MPIAPFLLMSKVSLLSRIILIACLWEIISLIIGIKEILIDGRSGLLLAKIIRDSGGKVVKQRLGYVNFIKTMFEKNVLFGCQVRVTFYFI